MLCAHALGWPADTSQQLGDRGPALAAKSPSGAATPPAKQASTASRAPGSSHSCMLRSPTARKPKEEAIFFILLLKTGPTFEGILLCVYNEMERNRRLECKIHKPGFEAQSVTCWLCDPG